jgi:hypothetical protein
VKGSDPFTVPPADEVLVARCRDHGDQQAFAELVGRYRDLVFRLVLSILGQQFAGDAEEVTQEVFVRAHLTEDALSQLASGDEGPLARLRSPDVIVHCRIAWRSYRKSTSQPFGSTIGWGAASAKIATLIGVPENTVKSYLHRHGGCSMS